MFTQTLRSHYAYITQSLGILPLSDNYAVLRSHYAELRNRYAVLRSATQCYAVLRSDTRHYAHGNLLMKEQPFNPHAMNTMFVGFIRYDHKNLLWN